VRRLAEEEVSGHRAMGTRPGSGGGVGPPRWGGGVGPPCWGRGPPRLGGGPSPAAGSRGGGGGAVGAQGMARYRREGRDLQRGPLATGWEGRPPARRDPGGGGGGGRLGEDGLG
jgi:hypothetical protein